MKLAKLILFGIIFVISACSLIQKYPLPDFAQISIPEAKVASLIEKLKIQKASLKTIKALVSANLEQNGKKNSFRYAVVAELPNRLRIDIFPDNAAYALGVFVSNETESFFIDGVTKERQYGEANELLTKILNMPLTKEKFIYYLLGIPENLDFINIFETADTKYLMLVNIEQSEIFLLDPKTLQTNSLELRGGFLADRMARVIYGNFEEIGVINLPKNIYLVAEDVNLSANFKITTLRVNEEVSDKLFTD